MYEYGGKRQLVADDTLLLPCGARGSNPGHQAWQKVPLPSKLFFPVPFQKSYTQLVEGGILHEVAQGSTKT